MFERFTADARQVVFRARQEAIELKAAQVGTEHLLLALVADSGPSGQVLRDAGMQTDAVHTALGRLVRPPAPLLDDKDAEALRSVGIDLDAVVARIEASFGPEALQPRAGASRRWLGRRDRYGRFSPRSKKVLELSLREAVRRNDQRISSGHILLGLLQENDGLAARILIAAELDVDVLRASTEQALREAA